MKSIILVITIFGLSFVKIFGQEFGQNFSQEFKSKINYIGFEFSHSRRIPYHIISINILKGKDNADVHILSKPMNDEKKWANTAIDTSTIISIETFNQLVEEVIKLNKIDLFKAFEPAGLDGTSCEIRFGSYSNYIGYTFWAPFSLTEQRGLTDFQRICQKIIVICGFNEDILY